MPKCINQTSSNDKFQNAYAGTDATGESFKEALKPRSHVPHRIQCRQAQEHCLKKGCYCSAYRQSKLQNIFLLETGHVLYADLCIWSARDSGD